MSSTETVIFNLEYSFNYIPGAVDGISNAESLLQPPFPANCMNWILGHILTYRGWMMGYAGAERQPLTPTEQQYYAAGSAPITGADMPHVPFERLVQGIHESQAFLLAAIPQMSEAQLAELRAPENPERGSKLTGFKRLTAHDLYHAGQLEQLRAMILAAR